MGSGRACRVRRPGNAGHATGTETTVGVVYTNETGARIALTQTPGGDAAGPVDGETVSVGGHEATDVSIGGTAVVRWECGDFEYTVTATAPTEAALSVAGSVDCCQPPRAAQPDAGSPTRVLFEPIRRCCDCMRQLLWYVAVRVETFIRSDFTGTTVAFDATRSISRTCRWVSVSLDAPRARR